MVSADFSWIAVAGAVEYDWIVIDVATSTVVDSGTTVLTLVTIPGLNFNTDYYFSVKTICEEGESDYVQVQYTTPMDDEDGMFEIVLNLNIIDELGGQVKSKPTNTIFNTPQTISTATDTLTALPNGFQHYYNGISSAITVDLNYPGDSISSNYLYLTPEDFEDSSATPNYGVYVRVSLDSVFVGDLTPSIPTTGNMIELDFSTLSIDLRTIQNKTLQLDVIFVRYMYRSLDTTTYLNTLFTGLNYPTT